jgi:hypothetical protein
VTPYGIGFVGVRLVAVTGNRRVRHRRDQGNGVCWGPNSGSRSDMPRKATTIKRVRSLPAASTERVVRESKHFEDDEEQDDRGHESQTDETEKSGVATFVRGCSGSCPGGHWSNT